MCGWHKEYLIDGLLELAWPFYRSSSQKNILKTLSEKDERGKSVVAVKAGKASAARLKGETDDSGRNLLVVRMEEMLKSAHKEKDEIGRSLLGVKNAERLHSEKSEDGKSLLAKRCAQLMNKTKHSQRDEHGRSLAGKESNFAKQARPIRVTNLETGGTFDFANSVDAGLALGLGPRSLRRVAAGERKKHKGFTAEFTDSKGSYT